MSAGLFLFIFLVGGSVFLLMEYPLIFWFVVVPIVILLGASFIRWLKK